MNSCPGFCRLILHWAGDWNRWPIWTLPTLGFYTWIIRNLPDSKGTDSATMLLGSSVVCNSTGRVSADQTKSFAKALHYSLFMHLGLRLLMFSRQCINFHLDPRWAKLVILLTFLSQTPHSHGSICGGQTYKSDHQLQLVLQKIKEEKVSETITKPSWCFIDYLNGKVHNL